MNWQQQLEIVGAEIFLRYRKRFLSPGIRAEIRRDYPGLSLPDVWLRVYAGRWVIREGAEFCALDMIRSGAWDKGMRARSSRPLGSGERQGIVSRIQVAIGGALFAAYCLLSMGAALADSLPLALL